MNKYIEEAIRRIIETLLWIRDFVLEHKIALFMFLSGVLTGIILSWAVPVFAVIMYWASFVASIILLGAYADQG